ncbi:MAG: hypothetical protein CMO55_01465 [Verrucomicrobiales bacterium]|nr:hypothetical protein [Verrucomicrobiales bacterium]
MKYRTGFIVSVLLSIVTGALMAWLATKHNPQSAIIDGESVDAKYLSGVFFSWVGISLFFSSAVIFGVIFFANRAGRKKG